MTGLDCLGTDEEIGFDYMAMLKGAAGALQGAGGMMSSGGGQGQQQTEQQRRLEEDKRRAEKSASTLKWVLIGLASLVGLGGVAYLVGRK